MRPAENDSEEKLPSSIDDYTSKKEREREKESFIIE
jgi:hypothetical protein